MTRSYMRERELHMFHLPADTTAVLLVIVGLIAANVIGIFVQISHLPKEETNE